jgi:outer membrane protein, heavy metal efflux system
MLRTVVSSAGVLALGLAGCASLDAEPKLQEAIDLVERQVGERPAWTVPWDEEWTVPADEPVLGMRQAVVLALRNNRELRADLEMIGQANADLVQAGLLQNPVINFMLMFPDGGGRAMLRSNALPMQPLQDLWLIPIRKDVAAAELRQAVLRVADRAVALAGNVKRVYARLQYTQRAQELIRDNIEVVDHTTGILEVQQAAGQATAVEVTLSRIRRMQLESDLLAMEAEHRQLQRELLMLMGIAGAADAWRVEPMSELEDPLEAPAEGDELLALVARQRLDVQAAEWTAQAAEERIRLMRREGWPDLAVAFTFERMPRPRSRNPSSLARAGNIAAERAGGMTSGESGGMGGASMSGPGVGGPFMPRQREITTLMGPMIDIEVPIFDQNQAQVARAFHEYRQRVAEYEAAWQDAARGVREASVMYRQAYDQVRFYREAILPAVAQNLELARETYIAGREALTVYLDVQEDLLTTRLRMLGFFRDYLVNRAELERQVGGRLAPLEPDLREDAP